MDHDYIIIIFVLVFFNVPQLFLKKPECALQTMFPHAYAYRFECKVSYYIYVYLFKHDVRYLPIE